MKTYSLGALEALRMRLPNESTMNESQRIRAAQPVQTIAVTGGKGGVGKTSVSVNLATASAASGKRVLLLDGDLGLANVDVLLGLSPRYTLAHVLTGERTLQEVLVKAPQGFHIVPGASGVAELANMGATQHMALVQSFSSLAQQLDMLIIDTAAGISHSVLQFTQAAQQVIMVICDEPASLTDAYALCKVLSRSHGVQRFHILANMTRSPGEGGALFEKFSRVTGRFLDVTVDYIGEIPDDPSMRRAIREQRPVAESYPSSPAGRAFKNLARKADTWPTPSGPRGNLEFFVERLVARPTPRLEVVQ
jgi:flagellar biosynthesis protein FlhG